MLEELPTQPHGPTSKERRYDRQLRLWGGGGQVALEDAHVLLINSGSGVVGVETLKNLVLPGVGQFTIQDSDVVTEEDLGVNFFLEEGDIGNFRAESCCKWLKELNPDVKGNCVTESLHTWIRAPKSLELFSLILVVLPASPQILQIISAAASQRAIPIFYIHCIGFHSHFTVQLPPAFPIVDTHPDATSTIDLRILNPWPELTKFVQEKTTALDSMDDEEHGHIPYVVILQQYLEIWKSSHDGIAPQTYKEKSEFRDLVQSGARTNTAEGGEENFEEAVAAVLKSLNPASASSSVREIFEAEECLKLTKSTPNFWIIAHAVKQFYEGHAILPLAGSLPDMKAKSADYMQLQTIYKSKARKDAEEVISHVRSLETKLDRPNSIDRTEIEAFCKHANYIKLIRGRAPHISKAGTIITWDDRARYCANKLTDPDSLLPLYIAFLAYDSYIATLASTEEKPEAVAPHTDPPAIKVEKITSIAHKYAVELLKEANKVIEDEDYVNVQTACTQAVEELVRADGGELHNIAALVGGMVSQEAIKVITKQYIPIDNTCLFDGITSKTAVLRL